MIKKGTSLIGSGKITIGSTPIQRVFVGNNLVYGEIPGGIPTLISDNGVYPIVPESQFDDLIINNNSIHTLYVYIASEYSGWFQPEVPVPTYSATTINNTIGTPTETICLNYSYMYSTYNFSSATPGYNNYITVPPGQFKTVRITKLGGDEYYWKVYLAYSTTPIISPPADDSRITVWTTAIGALESRCYLVLNDGDYPYVGVNPTEVTIFNPSNSRVDIYGAARLSLYNDDYWGVKIMYDSYDGLKTYRIRYQYSGYDYNYAGYVDANSGKKFYIGSDDDYATDLISYFSDSINGSFLY